jgi:serine/threonine protein kinase
MRDVCTGLSYVHDRNVVHRDVTSNNLVLDRSVEGKPGGGTVWIAKVCDFNLSQALPPNQQKLAYAGRMYSPLWASPELMTEQPYGRESDVYR